MTSSWIVCYMGSTARQLEAINIMHPTTHVIRTCDLVRRTPLASRYQNEKLHDTIIDLATARLYHKDILISDTG